MADAVEISTSGIDDAANGLPSGDETPDTPSTETPEVEAPKAPRGLPKIVPQDTPASAIEDAGVDLDALAREVFENGDLSETSRATLKAKGISEAVVDTYLEGQQAKAEQLIADLATHVGGQEQLDALLAWGATGLPKADVTAFNKMLTSGDLAQMKLALDGLQSRHAKVHGTEASLRITGATVPKTSGPKPFESQAQVIEAMSDKRWGTDSAYTRKVEDRLKVSDVFSVDVA